MAEVAPAVSVGANVLAEVLDEAEIDRPGSMVVTPVCIDRGLLAVLLAACCSDPNLKLIGWSMGLLLVLSGRMVFDGLLASEDSGTASGDGVSLRLGSWIRGGVCGACCSVNLMPLDTELTEFEIVFFR